MMRRFLCHAGLAFVLVGCAGPARPTVAPSLSSLPDEPEQRQEQLASAAARPGAESGRTSSSQAAQRETVAATLSAFLGMIFSTGGNTFVGVAVPFEENRLLAPRSETTPRERPE